MKIVVATNKGGVGKSTTVVTLSRIWRDRQPLIVDTDAQNATRLFSDCETVKAAPLDAAAVLNKTGDRLVLIDCPAHLQLSAPVLACADAILLPIECDILALNASVRAFDELRRYYPQTPSRAFLSRYNAQDKANREARDWARNEWGETLLKTAIHYRRAFSSAAAQGQTIIDFAPDSLPARQYQNLAKEVEQWLAI